MRWQSVIADVLVALHICYVSFVVLGQIAILIGALLRRAWVRNAWFRLIHLAMIGIVVLESWLRWPCPLTIWERQLREAAGQRIESVSFVGYWLRRILFFHAEPWVFTLAYTVFGLMVLLTFVAVPPRGPDGGLIRWTKKDPAAHLRSVTPSSTAHRR